MPFYSYLCKRCGETFEMLYSFAQYDPQPKCAICSAKSTERLCAEDAKTISTSVKKSDSELKTIGDLANRNRDRMSDDQKRDIYEKHNTYKDNDEPAPLPSGMTRMRKTTKTQWTDKPLKSKRKLNEKKGRS